MKIVAYFVFIGIAFGSFVAVPALAHEAQEAVVIHMYEDRYEPQDVEIEQGESVIFENVEGYHWPASNIHPTHRAYPNSDIDKCDTDEDRDIFDACHAMEAGEEYQFTFNNAGEWRYHDHVNPNLTGKITVLEVEGFEAPEIKEHTASPGELLEDLKLWLLNKYYDIFPSKREAALEELSVFEVSQDPKELEYWIKVTGPEAIMQKLLAESGGGATIDCHDEAHQVGRAAYHVFGGKAFESGDPACHSGYYHGAIEIFLAEHGTNHLAEDVEELCSIFSNAFGEFECLHGVGHGVMAYNDYDMPEAIEDCQRLGTSFAETSCYGGVFMENIVAGQGNGAIAGHETEWVSDDPHFPCNALGDDYDVRFQCYQMQTSWMLELFDYDFERVANECSLASDDMRTPCFISLGRDSAGYSLRDPNVILNNCSTAPEKYFTDCMNGGLHVIVDFWGDKLEGQASELCSISPESYKEDCYRVLSMRLPGLFADDSKAENVCKTFPSEYRYLCGI